MDEVEEAVTLEVGSLVGTGTGEVGSTLESGGILTG